MTEHELENMIDEIEKKISHYQDLIKNFHESIDYYHDQLYRLFKKRRELKDELSELPGR